MARLPIPGKDNGTWGDVLNDYLSQVHKSDGTLKDNTVTASTIVDGTITETLLADAVQTKLNATSPVTSVASKTGDVTLAKADVGLSNVDNTSDVNKPVSTATQTALNTKITKGDLVINVKDYGALGDGATDDITAFSNALAALSSGGTLFIPSGNYVLSSSLSPSSSTNILGVGNASRLIYTGTGSFVTHTSSHRNIKWRSLRVTIQGVGAVAFDLSNCFRNSWHQVTIDGLHTAATGSTYRTQIGFRLRDNAGDNRIIDCDINNLGNAVNTNTIMNYLIGCDLGTNYIAIQGGDASGVEFAAGLSMTGGTIVSSPGAACENFVFIEGSANQFWFHGVWMEGAVTGMIIGGAAGGPVGFHMSGCKVAATTKCIDIVHAKLVSLVSVRFSANPDQTPTALSIDAINAPDGWAAGLVTDMATDIAVSVFPLGWTYIGRSQVKMQRFTIIPWGGYLQVQRSDGATVNALYASGGPSTVLRGAGTNVLGSVNVQDSAGSSLLQVDSVTSSVNYPAVTPAVTTNAPSVTARGSDTNINLNLAGKGSGIVTANSNPIGVKVAVPATASATGVPGQWAADATHFYVCTATNTWVRSSLSTW